MPVELDTMPQTEIHDAPPQILLAGPRAIRQSRSAPVRSYKRKLFVETLLEASSSRHPNRTAKLFFSVGLHILALLALLLPPLYFTDTLDVKQFTQTFLVAPLPPPPPPPAPQALIKSNPAPRRVFLSGGKLIAPTVVPSRVVILKEEPLPPEMGIGIASGVPGGVPGGQLGGVIGGVISGASRTNLPMSVAATVQPKAPIRVGGRVRPPRILSKTPPFYPPLARQTRVEGTVSIDAVIDTEGNVVEMTVVSGHPLLISAALDAVKKWKYEPTFLNDQAVAVQLIVTVTFQLERR
jgi:periplasmic protein TonB